MLKKLLQINYLTVFLDVITAVLLGVWALIIGPLGVLRGPLVIDRVLTYAWVLAPQGLLTSSIKTIIDWRMGSFDAAIGQIEALIGSCEAYYNEAPTSKARRKVLGDLYTVLARAYLHAGHIDDAMLVVIRAKKSLGIERLSGLAELDAKTAHLVRAGLAAGRLLEGDGLATMFVKSNPTQPERKGASAASFDDDEDLLEEEEQSNIIPFPVIPRYNPEDYES